jgi:predicted nuclease with TOPRIM domain
VTTDLATELVEVLRNDLERARARVAELICQREDLELAIEESQGAVSRLAHENAWLKREVERLTREVNSLRGGPANGA